MKRFDHVRASRIKASIANAVLFHRQMITDDMFNMAFQPTDKSFEGLVKNILLERPAETQEEILEHFCRTNGITHWISLGQDRMHYFEMKIE